MYLFKRKKKTNEIGMSCDGSNYPLFFPELLKYYVGTMFINRNILVIYFQMILYKKIQQDMSWFKKTNT